MKPVHQQIFISGKGDCVRACVASVLELRLEDLPNFREQEGGEITAIAANKWLAANGLQFQLLAIKWCEEWQDYLSSYFVSAMECLFAVPSQMFPGNFHAVVGTLENGIPKIIHDPNPHNTPYPADVEIKSVMFFVATTASIGRKADHPAIA